MKFEVEVEETVDNNVLGKKIRVAPKTILLSKLNLNVHPPVETIWRRKDSERRKARSKASQNDLPITVSGLSKNLNSIPKSELLADQILTHRGTVLVDKHHNVIYGHDTVLKALLQKEKKIAVYVFTENLTECQILAIAIRHAAKENRLYAIDRMECIVELRDKHNLDFDVIQKLLNPSKAKESLVPEATIRTEYHAGRLYEELTGVKLNATGDEISKEAFSRIKMMCGNRQMLRDMQNLETRIAFVNSAVVSTMQGLPRFEEDLRKIVAHKDTYSTFKQGSFNQALKELKAKYPEESKDTHPHYDLVAARKKLLNPMVRESIIAFGKNGLTQKAFDEFILDWINDENNIQCDRLLMLLANNKRERYTHIDVQQNYDLIPEEMRKLENKVLQAARRVQEL